MKTIHYHLIIALGLMTFCCPAFSQFTSKWAYSPNSEYVLYCGTANLDDDANLEVVYAIATDASYHNRVYHVIDAITGVDEGTIGPYYNSGIYFIQINTNGKCGILVSHSTSSSDFEMENLFVKGSFNGFQNMSADQPNIMNYPNPFIHSTTIQYEVPAFCHVVVNLFNMQGNLVRTLVNEDKDAGQYTVVLDGDNLPSGDYLYQAVIGDKKCTKQSIHVN